MIEVVDFSKKNSVINLYMSELRDKNYQKNRLLFRHNIKRVGEMMAYELSKTLEYRTKTVTTPLGTIDMQLPNLITQHSYDNQPIERTCKLDTKAAHLRRILSYDQRVDLLHVVFTR